MSTEIREPQIGDFVLIHKVDMEQYDQPCVGHISKLVDTEIPTMHVQVPGSTSLVLYCNSNEIEDDYWEYL